jgi:hypothetical protein
MAYDLYTISLLVISQNIYCLALHKKHNGTLNSILSVSLRQGLVV